MNQQYNWGGGKLAAGNGSEALCDGGAAGYEGLARPLCVGGGDVSGAVLPYGRGGRDPGMVLGAGNGSEALWNGGAAGYEGVVPRL